MGVACQVRGLLQAVSRDQVEISTLDCHLQHASHSGPVWAHPPRNGAEPVSHLCMPQR